MIRLPSGYEGLLPVLGFMVGFYVLVVILVFVLSGVAE